MIRKSIIRLFPVVVILLAASCGRDDYAGTDIREGSAQKICFEMVYTAQAIPSSDAASGTRVSTSTDSKYTSTWTDGDEVGVYIVKGDGGLLPSGNWVDNMKMTCNSGKWTYTLPLNKEYFPAGDNLSFYAYYPYDATVTNALKMTISVLNDQSSAENLSKSDLLSAQTLNVEKGSTPVQLTFSHTLTMVELTVTNGESDGAQMSNKVEVTLGGCIPGISFNLSSGAANTSGSAKSVTMYRVEQSTDADYLTKYTYRALVPAQTVNQGTELFRFSQTYSPTNIRTLSYKVPSGGNATLLAGKVLRYGITLNPNLDHEYKVGEYYPYKGFPILGVVFKLDNGNGKKGRFMSLDYTHGEDLKWGDPAVNERNVIGIGISIRDTGDGSSGTKNLIMKRKDQTNPDFANVYKLFNWIYKDKNNSNVDGMWYLPASDEMKAIYTYRNIISSQLTAAGCPALPSSGRYYTLTEKDTSTAVSVSVIDGSIGSTSKQNSLNRYMYGIAVAKF